MACMVNQRPFVRFLALRGSPALHRARSEWENWPQAKKHTQWPGSGPGKGQKGDPIFDAFYATQVEYIADNVETQTMIRDAGSALLDKIGPAIVLTHSQAGPFGWLLADARPKLVKGVVAVEPQGPPFQNAVTGEDKARPWGITDIPVAYDPPGEGGRRYQGRTRDGA